MKNKKIYLIGEIGINHNGSIKLAKKLIDMAVECGCDAVKFQKRDIRLVYSKNYLEIDCFLILKVKYVSAIYLKFYNF